MKQSKNRPSGATLAAENRDAIRDRDSGIEPVDENRDPISGSPGAHPLGSGVGAAGGGVAGVSVGAVAGPIGAAVGLVTGAVAGGLAGKAVAEEIDPTVDDANWKAEEIDPTIEDAYWKEEYGSRPYAEQPVPYETYQPAYQVGYQGYTRHAGKTYDEVEPDLRRDYENSAGNSNLSWDKAKNATRDAWDRVERAIRGDADGDGR